MRDARYGKNERHGGDLNYGKGTQDSCLCSDRCGDGFAVCGCIRYDGQRVPRFVGVHAVGAKQEPAPQKTDALVRAVPGGGDLLRTQIRVHRADAHCAHRRSRCCAVGLRGVMARGLPNTHRIGRAVRKSAAVPAVEKELRHTRLQDVVKARRDEFRRDRHHSLHGAVVGVCVAELSAALVHTWHNRAIKYIIRQTF